MSTLLNPKEMWKRLNEVVLKNRTQFFYSFALGRIRKMFPYAFYGLPSLVDGFIFKHLDKCLK